MSIIIAYLVDNGAVCSSLTSLPRQYTSCKKYCPMMSSSFFRGPFFAPYRNVLCTYQYCLWFFASEDVNTISVITSIVLFRDFTFTGPIFLCNNSGCVILCSTGISPHFVGAVMEAKDLPSICFLLFSTSTRSQYLDLTALAIGGMRWLCDLNAGVVRLASQVAIILDVAILL